MTGSKMSFFSRSVLATLFSLFCCWPGAFAQYSASSRPMTADERAALSPSRAELAQGKILTETTCAGCHGLQGISIDENRPHLAGQRTTYLYRELQAYKNGDRTDETMRRAVRFLSEESMLQAAIYYSSLVPPRPESSTLSDRGPDWINEDPLSDIKARTAACDGCHGESGNSVTPGMPSLTAQHPDYFVAAMKAYQAGDRDHGMMQMLAASLDEESLQNMGLYYALQAPAASPFPGPGDAQAGSKLAEGCAGCHGPDGNTSSAGTPSIAGQEPVYAVSALKAYLDGQREHVGMASSMTGFNEDDLSNLATFYAQQEPVLRDVRRPLTTPEWIERCDRCHGTDGNSTDPRYAALAAQNEAYLARVLKAYADGQRSDSIMHAMSSNLSKGAVARLAAYYAAQESRSVVYVQIPCASNETD
jgi:cytochrome c553